MLTKLPEGSERKVGYEASGWTTYERCSAEQIKKFYLNDAKWKLVLNLGAGEDEDAGKQRRWPIGPDDFDTMIESRKFTNGADKDAVKSLYRKMSINQLGGIKMLDFDGMPAMGVEDGDRLGGCLKLCANLDSLILMDAGIGDEACAALFSQLGSTRVATRSGGCSQTCAESCTTATCVPLGIEKKPRITAPGGYEPSSSTASRAAAIDGFAILADLWNPSRFGRPPLSTTRNPRSAIVRELRSLQFW